MVLVFNIGNTNISVGVFEGNSLALHFKIRTNISYTEDQYYAVIHTLLDKEGISETDFEGAVIGSVVPAITHIFEHMLRKYFRLRPVEIAGSRLNVKNKYKNKGEVGDDRLANAVGARHFFGKRDMVIIDFGTGITLDVVNKKGEYLGGVIMPGLNLSLHGLFSKTAKLPQVKLKYPDHVLGNTTETSIQSGLLNGLTGAINHLIKGIKSEIKAKKIKVIMTGGDADMIPVEEISEKDVVIDKNFTLRGFKLIYDLNSAGSAVKAKKEKD
ncbi:MAG TPA: type III pantothenate kinase [Candidatus Goldiibacteriota bacterium]|nr:type III pantothenate kinase [Candidatus Goldiibacteriota bacterium]